MKKKLALTVLCLFALTSVSFASPLMDYSKGKAAIDITYRPSLDVDSKIGIDSWSSPSAGFDGDGYEWGITYGIGNKFALQYRQFNPTFDMLNIGDNSGELVIPVDEDRNGFKYLTNPSLNIEGKVKSEEYNVLYKIDKNVSAFTGIVRAQPSVKFKVGADLYNQPWGNEQVNIGSAQLPDAELVEHYGAGTALQGPTKNMWQIGLVGATKVFEKTNAYGLVAVGHDYRNWEVGLSYEVAKDLELNVNYRDAKFDKLAIVETNIPDVGDIAAKDLTAKGFGFGVTYKF